MWMGIDRCLPRATVCPDRRRLYCGDRRAVERHCRHLGIWCAATQTAALAALQSIYNDHVFIALVLPKELDEKVLHWKNFMHREHQCKVGLKSPAHITLVPPFWMDEEKEAALVDDVDRLSKTLGTFLLRANNFSAFKPRTIFY